MYSLGGKHCRNQRLKRERKHRGAAIQRTGRDEKQAESTTKKIRYQHTTKTPTCIANDPVSKARGPTDHLSSQNTNNKLAQHTRKIQTHNLCFIRLKQHPGCRVCLYEALWQLPERWAHERRGRLLLILATKTKTETRT